jgi:hypothetical protein
MSSFLGDSTSRTVVSTRSRVCVCECAGRTSQAGRCILYRYRPAGGPAAASDKKGFGSAPQMRTWPVLDMCRQVGLRMHR